MPSKMERFTKKAHYALTLAEVVAERLQHATIGPEHVLLALVQEAGSISARVLSAVGVDILQLEDTIKKTSKAQMRTEGVEVSLDKHTMRVLELAVDEARRMGNHYIGTEHLLLGIVHHKYNTGVMALNSLGISTDQVLSETYRILQEMSPPPTRFGISSLLDFVRMLFGQARGRDKDNPSLTDLRQQIQERNIRLVVKGTDGAVQSKVEIPADQLIGLLMQVYHGQTGKIGDWRNNDDDTTEVWVE
jgi:ATP-dependent Clp protease ATP-binding subunit ClpA